jgi:UDP-N-acetylmuramyl-tripeptide synthetase
MRILRTPHEAADWLRERVAGEVHCDSRKITAGDGFIAWPGAATDGRKFVPTALKQGARACLVEAAGSEAFGFTGDAVAAYDGLKAATGPIGALFYGEPSHRLDVLAVTGTNGKTSTAWWLAQALANVNVPCGLVGTLGIGRPPHVEHTGLTTPDPVLLQRHFRRFLQEGAKACAIEASSIGIEERRLDGTRIRVAGFTNFTQDHLDYHGSMDAYWAAKEQLFDWPDLQAAVVNVDDAKGERLESKLWGGRVDLWTVSCVRDTRIRALDIGYGDEGLRFTLAEAGDPQRHVLQTKLVGQYNVSNLLGVIGMMRAIGVPLAQAVAACADLLPVPGRMERLVEAGKPLVAVDYAHTPDALEKGLQALRPLAAQRGGKLWCVFGCGGDRDATKRPLMAAVAEKNADRVVVTSDNPRSEKPEAIISQILLGLSHRESVEVQSDRARAIAETIASAAAGDVILLAGKGHEDYQEVGGVKHPFSDQAHAQKALMNYAPRTSHPLPHAGEGRGEGGKARK